MRDLLSHPLCRLAIWGGGFRKRFLVSNFIFGRA